MTVKKLASAFAMVPGLLYRASRLGMRTPRKCPSLQRLQRENGRLAKITANQWCNADAGGRVGAGRGMRNGLRRRPHRARPRVFAPLRVRCGAPDAIHDPQTRRRQAKRRADAFGILGVPTARGLRAVGNVLLGPEGRRAHLDARRAPRRYRLAPGDGAHDQKGPEGAGALGRSSGLVGITHGPGRVGVTSRVAVHQGKRAVRGGQRGTISARGELAVRGRQAVRGRAERGHGRRVTIHRREGRAGVPSYPGTRDGGREGGSVR